MSYTDIDHISMQTKELRFIQKEIGSILDYINSQQNGLMIPAMREPFLLLAQRFFVIESVLLKRSRPDLTQGERAHMIREKLKSFGLNPKSEKHLRTFDKLDLSEIYTEAFPNIDSYFHNPLKISD